MLFHIFYAILLYLMIHLRKVRRDEGMDAHPVKFLQRAGEHSHEAILACSWPGFPIIFIFMIFFSLQGQRIDQDLI